MKTNQAGFPKVLLGAVVLITVWSGWNPHDRFTWWLEVAPGFLGIAALLFTFKRFPLTNLAYLLIAIHVSILLVGGHYTYARVPLFDWLKDQLHLARNHFDRVGHFAQGFVPAMIARELLIRRKVVQKLSWIPFLVVCICMAISASYELIEWWTAVGTGEASNDFIGSQGDIWDTQSDMFMALIGAISALMLLSKIHSAQITRLRDSQAE